MKVEVDLSGTYKKLKKGKNKTQASFDQQVLKDSNFFAPQDTSALINSSLIASRIGEGVLIWDVSYARKLYWNPQYNFSKDKNPNAQGLWFEAAKAMFISDWIKIVRKGYR